MFDVVFIERVAINATFGGFLVALLAYIAYMTAIPNALLRKLGTTGIILAMVASAGALVARTVVAGHAPLSNLFESMLYVILVLAIIFLVFYRKYPYPALGAGTAFIGVIGMGYASLVLPVEHQAAAPLMPALQSYWLKIHVSVIMASYAAFALAAVTAGTQLVIGARERMGEGGTPQSAVTNTGLRMTVATADEPPAPAPAGNGTAAALAMSPAVAFWDNLTYRLVALGFPLLTIGIICGAIWAKSAWGTYWSWDPKENWSLITLFVYSVYLHGRVNGEWTAQRRAAVAIAGFVAVVITYVGLNYFAGGLHSYGLSS